MNPTSPRLDRSAPAGPAPSREGLTDDAPLGADEARALAREAYIYGFPMVDHYRIQHAYFEDRGHAEYKGPWNQVHHTARVYTWQDRALQSPNSDTPYSFIGADLRAEPLVVTLPAVEAGRYYSAQFVDGYTHNFAFAGSRSTGPGGGHFLLAGPRWEGEVPAGITAVMRSETEFAYVMLRTQLLHPQDLPRVREVQAGYRVQPLSAFLGRPGPAPAPRPDFPPPLSRAKQRSAQAFFGQLNFLLAFTAPHPSEQALRQRMARLGVGPGLRFDSARLPPAVREALDLGVADAWKSLAELNGPLNDGTLTSGDLFGTREHLGNNYLYRMAAAVGGIYGMDREEALYPIYYTDAQGARLDGASRCYTLRFAPGQLPPARAFWSLTLYELPSRTLSRNPIDRYLVNSPMLDDLVRDADGGITLQIQHESPGPAREPNWLPAPSGPFYVARRLYWPLADALEGRWQRPPLVPIPRAQDAPR